MINVIVKIYVCTVAWWPIQPAEIHDKLHFTSMLKCLLCVSVCVYIFS